MEVSWGGPSDIERAAERTALLAKIRTSTLPVVAGWEITREAREKALTQGVWRFINATVVPPTSWLRCRPNAATDAKGISGRIDVRRAFSGLAQKRDRTPTRRFYP